MNNDRFKFRVWDNEEKDYLQEGALLDSRTGNIAGYFPDDNFTIEQCTGLRDRNNKLIYEGDILNAGEEICVVAWDEECYILEYPDGSIGEFALWCKRFAVIGTIHDDQFRDNTKLIEEKK